MSGASQEPSTIWDNIISKRNTLLSFSYKSQHQTVWKHRNVQSQVDEYYVTPIPRLIPSTIKCQESVLSGTKLVFLVEMWSHAIQDAAINAIHEHLGIRPTRLQVHPLPFQKIRLTHGSGHGRPDAAIRLESTWLPNTQEKFQRKFFFWAENMEICSNEKDKILENPESLADDLILEGLLTAEDHISRTLSVQSRHITKSKLFASLNSMDTQGTVRYLRSEDINKMAQQIASQVIATEISDVDYVPADDELSLKELIKGQLKAAKKTTEDFTRDQWESVFWDPTFARPDKITDFLQNTTTFDQGSQKFTWDENKAKEWAQTHKTDLQKMSRHFNHEDSDVNKDISGSGAVKIPIAPKLLDISLSGTKKNTEKKKSTRKKKSTESELEEDSDKGKDSVQLSQDEMDSWLRNNNVEVRVQGEMFQTKPVDLWRVNVHSLEQAEELLSKRVQVRRVKVETSFQVGVKEDSEQAAEAEEAEALRNMKISMLEEQAKAIRELKRAYFSILLIGGKECPTSAEWFYPWDSSRNRRLSTALPTPRWGHSSAILDSSGTVLIAGGYDGKERLSSAVLLDPITETWTSVKSMNVERSIAGATVVDGVVFVCGGWDGSRCLRSCERFRSGVWEKMAPMSTHRQGLAVVALDGSLYAIGGWDGSNTLSLVEAYDIQTDTWTVKAPLPSERSWFQAAVLGKSIIVCGGTRDDDRECMKYDVKADRWTPIAPMKHRRRYFSVLALDDSHLVALGGASDSAKSTAELYDPEKDEWTLLNANFKEPRREHSANVFMPDFWLSQPR